MNCQGSGACGLPRGRTLRAARVPTSYVVRGSAKRERRAAESTSPRWFPPTEAEIYFGQAGFRGRRTGEAVTDGPTSLRRLLWCAMLASLAVAWLALEGCGRSDPRRSEESVAGPIREMQEFTLVETHEGVRRVVVVGSHMTEQPDRHSVEVDSVKVDFYDEEGGHQSVLTARSGTVQTQTGDMVVRGNVVVVTDDGIRLETDELRWLNERRRIVTDLPVRILREEGEVTGVGLETDPELREFRLGEQIEGEWQQRQ